MDLTSLISVWEMDEASGDALDAHGSNTLIDNNTVGATAGLIGGARACAVATDRYFSITDNASISTGDNDFTFTALVKATSLTNNSGILGKWGGTQNEYALLYLSSRFLWTVTGGATQTSVNADNLGAPATATWYFIACWHDSVANTINIQVNNGAVNSVSHTAGVNDSNAAFCVGRYLVGSTAAWDGPIDQTTFWKRVLTSGERTILYNGGVGLAYPFGYAPTTWLSTISRKSTPTEIDPTCPINWDHPLNRGLVGEWAVVPNGGGLRGGKRLRDLVRGGRTPHDGALVNGPTWAKGNRPGGYGSLNYVGSSSQYVNAGTVASTGFGSGNFALSAWIKPTSVTTTQMIIAKDDGTSRQCFLNLRSTGAIQITLLYSGNSVTSWATPTGVATANVWQHVLGQRVGNTFEIYLNGKSASAAYDPGDSSANLPQTMNSVACNLNIGRREFSLSTFYFTGGIDDAAIFNLALPAARVMDLYRESRLGNPDRWRWLGKRVYSIPKPAPTTWASAIIRKSSPGTEVDPSCPINWDHPLNRGLVGEWACVPNGGGLRGGNRIRDLVRGGRMPHDGVLTNGPTWVKGNRPGGYGGIGFNGSTQSVAAANAAALNLGTSNLTISAFVRFTSFSNAYQNVMIKGTTGRAYGLVMYNANTTYNVGIDASPFRTISITLSAGVWYHLCAVRGTSNSFFYVNGKQVDTDTRTSGANNAESLSLGLGTGGFGYLSGNLDAAMLFNLALPAARIMDLYKESRRGNPDRWRWLKGNRTVMQVTPPTLSYGISA